MRAVRRAKLPVAYSEGFSPRPRIAFGLALPTGAESIAEYLDIDFGQNEVDIEVGSLAGIGVNELEAGVIAECSNVAQAAGEQVVEADDVIAALDERLAEMTADEARPAGNQSPHATPPSDG